MDLSSCGLTDAFLVIGLFSKLEASYQQGDLDDLLRQPLVGEEASRSLPPLIITSTENKAKHQARHVIEERKN